jgi:hypothetical protein
MMANSIVADYLDETYFALYQRLRDELMEGLDDADLEVRLGGETETIGALCREIGEIEHTYVESLRTFRQDFGYRHPDPQIEHSVDALRTWYGSLDRDLMAAIEALSEDDIEHRHIVRSDFDEAFFSPLARQQLDTYREALLIFYGKVSVYLKALGRSRTEAWRGWIG